MVFEYGPDPNLPETVLGDEKRLSQVLLNLLGNAVKFTQYGSVRLKAVRVGCGAPHGLSPSGNRTEPCPEVQFSIEDTGPGIPTDQIANIFDPFVQFGNSYQKTEGVGLGLSICRHLVRLMGADLQVASEVGAGNTFRFTIVLPEVPLIAAAPVETAARIVGIHGKVPRILIVDDHADNRAMLRYNLSSMGFSILEAGNGREALVVAERERPDLVLMDLMMPELDGYEATRRMRSTSGLADLKIVILTANATVRPEELTAEIDCDAVLTKPLWFEQLTDLLHKLLGVEWIHADSNGSEETDTRPMELPPSEELDELRRLAKSRSFTRLLRKIDGLADGDPRYAPFAAHFIRLLDGFEFDTILKRLGPS